MARSAALPLLLLAALPPTAAAHAAPPAACERSSRAHAVALVALYTSEVFVAMRELRNWRDPLTFDQRLEEINRQPAGADIRLAMRSVAARSLEATASFSLADGATGRRGLQGVLVLYQDRLTSSVRRGENRGALLQHDRVVRFWSPPLPLPLGRPPSRCARRWRESRCGPSASGSWRRVGHTSDERAGASAREAVDGMMVGQAERCGVLRSQHADQDLERSSAPIRQVTRRPGSHPMAKRRDQILPRIRRWRQPSDRIRFRIHFQVPRSVSRTWRSVRTSSVPRSPSPCSQTK